jgi:amino acid transporter
MPADPPTTTGAQLRRALGRWDLTALGVNQVVGAAIFLTPSLVAAQIGNWSTLAFVLAGGASLLVALCYAEVGSRFDATGGPYLYTRAALGRFVAFEVAWLSWFTRVASFASILNGLALALGFYWPAVESGVSRAVLITTLLTALTLVQLRGIRESAVLVDALTLGKLAPLLIFVLVGLPFVDWSRLSTLPPIGAEQAGAAALLLIFTFGGFEVAGVPSGEARDPRKHLAFALIATIVTVTAVMTLANVVAAGTLADVAETKTPIADAAQSFMGPAGAMLIGVGSVLAMTGNTAGGLLAGSRMLFALAENGELPRSFARVHAGWRTPTVAILFSASVGLVLALTGSFAVLLAASALARLLTYAGIAAATLILRRPRFAVHVAPALFVVPGGPVIPVLALLVSFVIAAGATAQQWTIGGAAVVAGAALFALARVTVARVIRD